MVAHCYTDNVHCTIHDLDAREARAEVIEAHVLSPLRKTVEENGKGLR